MTKIIDNGSVLNLPHQPEYVKSAEEWAAGMAACSVSVGCL